MRRQPSRHVRVDGTFPPLGGGVVTTGPCHGFWNGYLVAAGLWFWLLFGLALVGCGCGAGGAAIPGVGLANDLPWRSSTMVAKHRIT